MEDLTVKDLINLVGIYEDAKAKLPPEQAYKMLRARAQLASKLASLDMKAESELFLALTQD